MSAELSYVSSQFTHLTDRWTDRQTDRRTALQSGIPHCIQCSDNMHLNTPTGFYHIPDSQSKTTTKTRLFSVLGVPQHQNLCYKDYITAYTTRKRAIAKALQLKGHSDFAPVDLAYYQHFLFFCSKILRFGKFRVATTNAGHVTPRPSSTIN